MKATAISRQKLQDLEKEQKAKEVLSFSVCTTPASYPIIRNSTSKLQS